MWSLLIFILEKNEIVEITGFTSEISCLKAKENIINEFHKSGYAFVKVAYVKK